MTTVRTALVGCGKVGQIHAGALATLPESHFVAVCDSRAERAAAFAVRYGVSAYPDVATMLRASRPQAVLICTPHPLHAAPALAAAEARAHVLVEKPLAATLADCDAMLEAGRRDRKRERISPFACGSCQHNKPPRQISPRRTQRAWRRKKEKKIIRGHQLIFPTDDSGSPALCRVARTLRVRSSVTGAECRCLAMSSWRVLD
jgi:NAD-dependent oxidoreductase involved in siderophore biosynthesis